MKIILQINYNNKKNQILIKIEKPFLMKFKKKIKLKESLRLTIKIFLID